MSRGGPESVEVRVEADRIPRRPPPCAAPAPRARRAAEAALVAAAAGAGATGLAAGLWAHLSDFQAPAARLSLDAQAWAAALTLLAVLLAGTTRRWPARSHSGWLIAATALLGTDAVMRVSSNPNSPPTRLGLVVSVAAVGILGWRAGRAGGGLRSDPLAAVRTWLTVALASVCVCAALGGDGSVGGHRATELDALRGVTVAAATAHLAVLLRRRTRTVWGVVALVAPVASAIWLLSADDDDVRAIAIASMVAVAALAIDLLAPRRAVLRGVGHGVERTVQLTSDVGSAILRRADRMRRRVVERGGRIVACTAPVGIDGEPASTGSGATRADRRWFAAMSAVALASLSTSVWWAYRNGWQLTGDGAIVAARAADVGGRHTPLLGMPTQLGEHGHTIEANHPGPANFDLIAPFVQTLGFRDGAFVGSMCTAFGAWLLAVWSAFRAGGRVAAGLAWTIAPLAICFLQKGDVWDPILFPTTLVMFAGLFCCWATSTGTTAAWPWAVATACVSAQTYLPQALVVVGPVVWAGLVLSTRARRGPHPEAARRAIRRGWIVLALLWMQPAISTLSTGGENLRALWRALSANTTTVGVSGLWHAPAWLLRVPPLWDRFEVVQSDDYRTYVGRTGPTGWVVLGALVVLGVVTRRTATTSERRLLALAAVTVALASVTLTQLPADDVRWYYLLWLGIASFFLWFVVAYTAVATLRRRRPASAPARRRARPLAMALGSVVVVAAGFAGTGGLEQAKVDRDVLDRAAAAMSGPAAEAARSSPVLVIRMDATSDQLSASLTGNLIASGRDVLVEAPVGNYFGRHRVPEQWDGSALALLDGSGTRRPAGARRLARVEPSGWSQERFDRLATEIATWAAERGPIVLVPNSGPDLAGSIDGWTNGLTCSDLERLVGGRAPLSSLPPGAIARLYAHGRIASPALPPRLQSIVDTQMTNTPVELWHLEQLRLRHPPDGTTILRNGEQCTR